MARKAEVTKSLFSVGAVDMINRTFEAMSSIPEPDRDREYVPVSAFVDLLPIYKKNPILLLGHNHRTTIETLPIGKALEIEPRDDGLWTKFYVTRRPIGDDILCLVDEGILRGLSVGFIPVDYIANPSDHELPLHLRGKGLKKYYKKVEIVEISLLSIPSNRDSLVIHAEKGNRVAEMVLKGYDGGDVTPIVKEWLMEEKSHKNSLWLGFSLTSDSQDELAGIPVPGRKQPKKDLHMTLRYFGQLENKQDVEAIKDAIVGVENTLDPQYDLTGVSYEAFGDDSFVARYRSGAVSQLHEKVNALLKSNDLLFAEDYPHPDFHVTLSEGKDLPLIADKPPHIKTERLLLKWDDEIVHEFTPHQVAWNTFVGKFFGWMESEHPRGEDGRFVSDGESDAPRPSWFGPRTPDHQELNTKLDQVLVNQNQMRQDIQEIKDKDGWGAWAKKWIVRVGGLVGAYYGIKHIANSPEAKEKIRNWLAGIIMGKGAETPDSIDKLLHVLDLTKAYLDRGKTLNAQNTPEYKKIQTFFDRMVGQLKNLAVQPKNSTTPKGLGQLWVTKEMTPEEFDESEHPRAADGKFRRKDTGSGLKKTKVEHVDESHEIPVENKTEESHESEATQSDEKKTKKQLNDKKEIKRLAAVEVGMAHKSEEVDKLVKKRPKKGSPDEITWKEALVGIVAYMAVSLGIAAARDPKQFKAMMGVLWREGRAKAMNIGGAQHGKSLYEAAKNAEGRMVWWHKEAAKIEKRETTMAAYRARAAENLENFRKGGHLNVEMPPIDIDPNHIFEMTRLGITDAERVNTAEAARQNALKWEEIRHEREVKYNTWEDRYFGRKARYASKKEKEAETQLTKIKRTVESLKKAKAAGETINEGELRMFEDKLAKLQQNHLSVRIMNYAKNILVKIKSVFPGISKDKNYQQMSLLLTEDAGKSTERTGRVGGIRVRGVDDNIVTKEMTAEEFVESEHPRDADGKFRDKNTPSADSGSWGGARKHAGRTPKDPIIARQKVEEKIRQQNPNISDEELKQKVIEHAVEKKNADLYQYVTDPVGYQKKRDQDMLDAMASTPSVQRVGKKRIPKINDEKEVNQVYHDLRTTKAEWDRQVQQAADVHEAIQTFKNSGEAEKAEEAKAKLVTAAAAIASVIGIGVLYAKRPSLMKSGFHEAFGAEHGATQSVNSVLNRENPTWVRWKIGVTHTPEELQAMSDPEREAFHRTSVEMRQIGAIRKLLGKDASKLDEDARFNLFGTRDIEAAKGKTIYPFAGPNVHGYEPGSPYHLGIFRKVNGHDPNFVMSKYSEAFDVKTGVRLWEPTQQKRVDGKWIKSDFGVEAYNLAIAHDLIPKNPAEWGTGKWVGKLPPGLEIAKLPSGEKVWSYHKVTKTRTVTEKVTADEVSPTGKKSNKKTSKPPSESSKTSKTPKETAPEDQSQVRTMKRTEKIGDVLGNEVFVDWLKSKKVIGDRGEVRWPKDVMVRNTAEEHKKFNEAAAQFSTTAEYIMKKVLPPMSSRTLSMLTATTSAAGVAGVAETAYYFHKNIEDALGGFFKQREEEREVAGEVAKPPAKSKNASEVALVKAQTQLAKAEGKAADKRAIEADRKRLLEDKREQVRNDLVKSWGLRRLKEGSVPMWASDPETFYWRLRDSGQLDSEIGILNAVNVLFKSDDATFLRYIQKVDKIEPTKNKKFWKEQYPEKEKEKENSRQTEFDFEEPSAEERQANVREDLNNQQAKKTPKEYSGLGLILKMFEKDPEEIDQTRFATHEELRQKAKELQDKKLTLDDAITLMAGKLARMISDISQSCKLVVESGMPGNSGYAQLNDIVTEIYAYLKDHARQAKKQSQESVQKGFENAPMTSQIDMGGGLFAERRRCKVCGREVNEDMLLKCQNAKCPATYLTKIESKN